LNWTATVGPGLRRSPRQASPPIPSYDRAIVTPADVSDCRSVRFVGRVLSGTSNARCTVNASPGAIVVDGMPPLSQDLPPPAPTTATTRERPRVRRRRRTVRRARRRSASMEQAAASLLVGDRSVLTDSAIAPGYQGTLSAALRRHRTLVGWRVRGVCCRLHHRQRCCPRSGRLEPATRRRDVRRRPGNRHPRDRAAEAQRQPRSHLPDRCAEPAVERLR
jgi:hypothetical protein